MADRRWTMPTKLFGGRVRTSTVFLLLAFLATAVIYSFTNEDTVTNGPAEPVPSEQTPGRSTEPAPMPASPATTTSSSPAAAPSSAVATTATTSATPTAPPLIVLPPGVKVPPGVQLPPGIVESPAASSPESAPNTP